MVFLLISQKPQQESDLALWVSSCLVVETTLDVIKDMLKINIYVGKCDSEVPTDGAHSGKDSDRGAASPVWAVLVSPPPLCWSSSWSSGPACAGARRSLWGSSKWHLCWVCGWQECHHAQVEPPQLHLQNNSFIGGISFVLSVDQRWSSPSDPTIL